MTLCDIPRARRQPLIPSTVIEDLFTERTGLWRTKREFLHLARSQFVRDQFMEGYRVGYHKGRAEEKVSQFNVLLLRAQR